MAAAMPVEDAIRALLAEGRAAVALGVVLDELARLRAALAVAEAELQEIRARKPATTTDAQEA